jgi:hypothetical protein
LGMLGLVQKKMAASDTKLPDFRKHAHGPGHVRVCFSRDCWEFPKHKIHQSVPNNSNEK